MMEIIGKEALLWMQLLPEKIWAQGATCSVIHHIHAADHAVLYFIFTRVDILQAK